MKDSGIGQVIRKVLEPIRRRFEKRVPQSWSNSGEVGRSMLSRSGAAPEGAGPDAPPPWAKSLQAVLSARGCSCILPGDLGEALALAGTALQAEGGRLAQSSLWELGEQVRIARQSATDTLLVGRLEKFDGRVEALEKEWTAEWERAIASEETGPTPDPVARDVVSRLAKDIEKSGLGRSFLRTPGSLGSGAFIWNRFSGAEVALGAVRQLGNFKLAKQGAASPHQRADAISKLFADLG